MVRLIRRLIIVGSAGTAGWLLWSRRGSSSTHELATQPAGSNTRNGTGAWPPVQPDPDGSQRGSSANERAAAATAQADTAMRIAADAVAGETEARFETAAARTDAARANAKADAATDIAAAALTAEQLAEADAARANAQTDAAIDIANAALTAEQLAEADAARANAQTDAAIDIANAALTAEQLAEADAADARAEAAAADATADAALGFAANVASAVDQVDWNLKWVPPNDDGTCPASHPIKGNDGSKIYHVPGGMSYRRTKAERCYAEPADAEADGYRPSKR